MANRTDYTQDKFLQRYAQMLTPDDGAYIAYNPLACPVIDVDTMTGNFITVGGGFAAESPFDDMVLTDGMDKPNIIPTTISKTSGWAIQQHGLGVNVNKQSQMFAEGNGNDLRRAKTAHLMAHTRSCVSACSRPSCSTRPPSPATPPPWAPGGTWPARTRPPTR